MSGLAELQRWMQAALLDPRGPLEGAGGEAAIEARLTGTGELPARARLEVYARMIALRLEECLREDFPCLHAALEGERWDQLVSAYLVEHPPRHRSLDRLGEDLPGFLEARAAAEPTREARFLAELAQLERALAEVFSAPDRELARAEDFQAIPPERWRELRLELSPAARLLAFEHDVDGAFQAWRERREPPRGRKRATWLLVHRRAERAWRTALEREQHALLAALADGATLGEALERAAALPDADPAHIAAQVGEWFRGWAREGLFLPPRAR